MNAIDSATTAMRHFTQVEPPALARKGERTIDGTTDATRDAFDAAHERAEDEFRELFGRAPDYPGMTDSDVCWSLFLTELEMMAESERETAEDEDGRHRAEVLATMVEHYRAAWQQARRDAFADFIRNAGLQQKQLAVLLDHSQNTVSGWKTGSYLGKETTLPEWLLIWCELWQESDAALRASMLAQTDGMPRSWLGRMTEMLLSLPDDRRAVYQRHLRLVENA